MGIHAFSHLWNPNEKEIKAARAKLAGESTYQYQESVTEHQLDDLKKELDFKQLDAEIIKICDRFVELYDTARSIFNK
jgi:hypothetical protein